jgi:hypothetical protein
LISRQRCRIRARTTRGHLQYVFLANALPNSGCLTIYPTGYRRVGTPNYFFGGKRSNPFCTLLSGFLMFLRLHEKLRVSACVSPYWFLHGE